MPGRKRAILDFAGASLASFLATASDGLAFAALQAIEPDWGAYTTGLTAFAGAAVGAVIHYSLMRFWVFRRFDASFRRSIPLYLFMSASAGVAHGVLTQFAAAFVGAGLAWFISKASTYVLWTYPFSRWVVFAESGADPGQRGGQDDGQGAPDGIEEPS